MGAQTKYRFSTPIGAAGGIVDLAPYAIDTFLNEEETGKMKFGLGVVQGTTAGSQVKLPTAAEDKFEGVTTNNRTTEYDMEGKINVRKGVAMGVMRYGRIYVRVASDATPKYGDPLYLVCDEGEDQGCFTQDEASNMAVAGRFLGAPSDGIAVAELFNSPAPAKADP